MPGVRGFESKNVRDRVRPSSLFIGIFALCLVSACGGGGGGGTDSTESSLAFDVQPIATGLPFPVGLVALPDGRLLFSELKTGRIRIVEGGAVKNAVFATVDVPVDGADGALGLAVDPEFSSNGFVYLFHTTPALTDRVVRFTAAGDTGVDATVIIDNLPYGFHSGGKLGFDNAGNLFVSTGDLGTPDISQDPTSLAGKVLRYTRDGDIPGDNPFAGSPVYATGFRNVFGLAFDARTDRLFVSDNGPDCDDELNLVRPGANYGWRAAYQCGETVPGFEPPLERFPMPLGITGIAFYRGDAFPELRDELLVGDYNFGGLRRYRLSGDGAVEQAAVLFEGGYGPILEITSGADGLVYFTTQDGLYRLAPKS